MKDTALRERESERRQERAAAWALLRKSVLVCPGWNIAAALASCLVTLTVLALPYLLGKLVQDVMEHGRVGSWGLLLTVLVVNTGATMIASYARNRSVGETARWLRGRVVDRVLDEGLAIHERFAVGDLTARLIGSTMDVARASYDAIATAIAAIGSLYIAVALLLLYWPLAVIFLCALVLSSVVVRGISMGSLQGYQDYQATLSGVAGRLTDALLGARTIWANGTRDREIARVLDPLEQLGVTGRQNWVAMGRAGRVAFAVAGAAEVAVLAVAGAAVAAGRLESGALVTASGYLAVGIPFFSEAAGFAAIPQILASALRVAEILSPAVPRPADAEAAAAAEPGLVLTDVSVRRGDTPALTGVSLRVPPGRAFALVGAPGSGKTTLALVAGGLLQPVSGSVCLGGVRVGPGDAAFAFERPGLVGTTIRDALAYGRPDTPLARIEQAAGTAYASHFVEQLTDGYETPLLDVRLSGGEVQRLGIARALVQDARVVVLDDALSSLDAATEVDVSRELGAALSGRIRLMIARRPLIAAAADQVVWLENGKVRALAPHRQLWPDPEYRALFGVAEVLASKEGAE
ncbi:ABC transporter transmembrane domain-containing protein [Actinacidiphila glaucinigra]|uniref:ABC transporter transmembrane domain-containing protein n=1 Tax=Actinacidiphila glaucinigra TaxID=235986 RepID=UPI0037A1B039